MTVKRKTVIYSHHPDIDLNMWPQIMQLITDENVNPLLFGKIKVIWDLKVIWSTIFQGSTSFSYSFCSPLRKPIWQIIHYNWERFKIGDWYCTKSLCAQQKSSNVKMHIISKKNIFCELVTAGVWQCITGVPEFLSFPITDSNMSVTNLSLTSCYKLMNSNQKLLFAESAP